MAVAWLAAWTACTGNVVRSGGPGGAQPQGGSAGASTGRAGTSGGPASACRAAPRRVWRLTAQQLERTFDALLGEGSGAAARLAPLQPRAPLFSNQADLLAGSENTISELFDLAAQLAKRAVAKPETLAPCLATQLGQDACVKSFIDGFGLRAFRRPLDADEAAEYLTFFTTAAAAGDRAAALELLVRRLLVAPPVLFRSELGEAIGGDQFRLTAFELASALSYFLLDGPPDAELLQAARSGALKNRAELERQTKRLLATADTARGLETLVAELLGKTAVAERMPADVANRDALVASMTEEPVRLVRAALWDGDHRLATLVRPPYALVDDTLAGHYGLPRSSGAGWTKVPVTSERRGLFTTGAMLVGHPTTTTRGVHVRNRWLCQQTPSPPPDTETDLQKQQARFEAQSGGKLTPRQVRELHMNEPKCRACHSQLDPVGFPFDVFDRSGKRLDASAGAVDTTGELTGTPSTDGKVANVDELVTKLAGSADVRACFVRNSARYALGRELTDDDACFVDALASSFGASGGDVLELVTDLVTSDAFVVRRPFQEN